MITSSDLIALADGETTPEAFEAEFGAFCQDPRGRWMWEDGRPRTLGASVLDLARRHRDLQRRVEQLAAVQQAATPRAQVLDRRLVESAIAFMIGYLSPEEAEHPEALRLLRDVQESLNKATAEPAPRIARHHGLSEASIYIGAMPLRISVHNGQVLVDEGDRQAIAEAMGTTWLTKTIEQLEHTVTAEKAHAPSGAYAEGRRSALVDMLQRLRERLER